MPIVYKKIPCLKGFSVKERKKIFINLLLPAVLVKNFEIAELRKRVLWLLEKAHEGSISEKERVWLSELMEKYRASSYQELLRRLDVIPAGIVIAQAAIESGWGSSRFFCEANNIFGEWDFSAKGTGVKAKDSEVYLKRFPDILAAVDSYYYSINAGWAYKEFREARAKAKGSLELAKYLFRYSQLGEEYVERLVRIIRQNGLYRYDNCTIDPDYISSVSHFYFDCPGPF